MFVCFLLNCYIEKKRTLNFFGIGWDPSTANLVFLRYILGYFGCFQVSF